MCIVLPADSNQLTLRYYPVTGMPQLRPANLGTEHNEYRVGDIDKGDEALRV